MTDKGKAGERTVVTHRDESVAEPIPKSADFNEARARRVVAGLVKTSRGLSLGGLKIKALIGEGRA